MKSLIIFLMICILILSGCGQIKQSAPSKGYKQVLVFSGESNSLADVEDSVVVIKKQSNLDREPKEEYTKNDKKKEEDKDEYDKEDTEQESEDIISEPESQPAQDTGGEEDIHQGFIEGEW